MRPSATALKTRALRIPDQCVEVIGTQKQSVWMAGKLQEAPFLIEGLRRIIDAIEDNGDECKSFAGLMAVVQRLCEQEASESLPLTPVRNAEPRENGDR